MSETHVSDVAFMTAMAAIGYDSAALAGALIGLFIALVFVKLWHTLTEIFV